MKHSLCEYSINDIILGPAGVVSSAMANPTDVLKVRLQSGRKDLKEKSLLQAFLSIYRQEGVQGLWRVSFVFVILCWYETLTATKCNT